MQIFQTLHFIVEVKLNHIRNWTKSDSVKTSTILEQDLREFQNSAILFAEMGSGQADQHISRPPVHTLC